ncbi:MAG TPA: hypothetical protein PLR32_02445 [candidate division Zixibacteria bacterium]|nr:hypothetical protein [candidate division Zixibacteria bacterium]MDD4916826.1 hypothetical protein [candidate division Zixibacteria bacterium]MDM7972229.1 hypothetical protein [candidate division Zixibacteria bacterium]HOD65172.1 hypothetical protein [candidate division Zixibacteria bacterium]HPI32146.1 hypothetical protein [candidate division Zixibacteria bacterium]
MIIKSFTAESASAAMKQARREMGGDAIVLKTRQLTDRYNRPQVEITACLEKPTVGRMSDILDSRPASVNRLPVASDGEPAPAAVEDAGPEPLADEPGAEAPVPSEDRLARIEATLDRLVCLSATRGGEEIADPAIRAVAASLRDADVPEDFIDAFLLARPERFLGPGALAKIRSELVKELSRLMVPDLKFRPGDRVLFVGPAGAGKSSVMGKLAAHLAAVEKRKVALAGVDFQKVGAHEELAGYADLLNLDVAEVAGEHADKAGTKDSITLIDAPALPAEPDRREALVRAAAKIGARYRFLVIPATMRSADAIDLAARYRWFGPTHLAATMLDVTRRQGVFIAAARAAKVKMVFFSDSPGGLGRLKAADPAALAATLTGREAADD